jgi:2,4-dienoyl-CoA reductase-like NADH-dependent reductase (Old Yellow Enzyme family)
VRTEQDKLRDLTSSTSNNEQPEFTEDQLTLRPFREALENTPCIVAGGYNYCNCWEGIERVSRFFFACLFQQLIYVFVLQGDYDAIAFGRYFTSNLDLVEKLRNRKPFAKYGELSLRLCS